jgi:hypothetical protein
MIWKILRPHYWVLDRMVRNTNRMIIIALLVLPIFGVQWVYDNLIVDNLAILNSDQAVTAIATFLPLGLIALLVFAMLGVGDVMHQLYLTSDLELLMVAPIPSRAIYLVKFLGCSRATYIPALGIGASLMLLGIARGATVGYHLLVGSLILAAMMLTTALVMILVILLARFLPAQKVRSWMPAVIAGHVPSFVRSGVSDPVVPGASGGHHNPHFHFAEFGEIEPGCGRTWWVGFDGSPGRVSNIRYFLS